MTNRTTPSDIAGGLSEEERAAVWQFQIIIVPRKDRAEKDAARQHYPVLAKLGILNQLETGEYMTGPLYWPVFNALFSRQASDTPNPKASP